MRLTDTFKDIYELAKKAGTIDLQQKIMALQEETLELKAKNQELSVEVHALKEQLSLQQELIFEKGIYWRIKNGNKEGPFCQCCFDEKAKLIRLQVVGAEQWLCLSCKSLYGEGEDISDEKMGGNVGWIGN